MDEMLSVLRLTHVAAGVAGLVAFWVPMLTRKGGRAHKVAGRVFAICVLYAAGTGLALSLWAVIHPPGFFGDPGAQRIDPEDLQIAIAHARFLYSITGFLAISVLAGTLLGVRIAQTHRQPERLAAPAVKVALGLLGVWSVGLVAFGVWHLIATPSSGHPLAGGGGRYGVSVLVGLIGIWGFSTDVQYIRRAGSEPAVWLPKHMECMLGAGIGFHAAALFFGVNVLLDLGLEGAMRFAPLVLPFVIGAPLMWWYIAREERRLGNPGS